MNKRINKLMSGLKLEQQDEMITAVSADDIKKRVYDSLELAPQKTKSNKSLFKPARILVSAAVIVLMVGLLNITTVIAFINGLFFAPGVGVTTNPVIYYGIDGPIDIETEYGLLTLKFANKIIKDSGNVLGLYIYSLDIPAQRAHEDYPLSITISANGEIIVSDEIRSGGGGWGTDGSNYVNYQYAYEYFPDINKFDLTILGIETHITLTHQPSNFALSKENNGITLAVSKFNGVTDMTAHDVYDNSESANDYYVTGMMFMRSTYYDENEEIIWQSSGSSGFDPNAPLNYQIIQFYKNEREIQSIKTNQINIDYSRKEPLAFEIPIPKDGEAIQVNIEIPIGSHTLRITEICREGNIIYYENNSAMVRTESGAYTSYGIPNYWIEDSPGPISEGYLAAYEKAVADQYSYIEFLSVSSFYFLYGDEWDSERWEKWEKMPRIEGNEISNFDENAETLTLYFTHARVVQYGDFDIEFN